ncbi:MAG: hypothetical protein K2W96_08645, partial [Gemmataceae bacterium]|nr:hypothetical protein [Gemmataceae bacterium]
KALALQAPDGTRAVLVASDLIGIPRSLAGAVRAATKLEPRQLMLTCSHTHCGPVVADNLADMYDIPPDEAKKIGPFTETLKKRFAEAVGEALENLAPATLRVGMGSAGFALNRRLKTAKGFIGAANPDGPVDHDVPVLSVRDPKGKLVAVAFGYACHNTTMGYLKWSGDYAGFAQQEVEKRHPGAVALFWSGCGADANPLPRGKVELARKYGKMLADGVEAVLKKDLKPVEGGLVLKYEEIPLAYASLPTKAKLVEATLGKSLPERKRAEKLLKAGKLDDHYRHFPVQCWKLGGQATWIALGGETCVDYSLRLKKELKGERAVWVAGYANDVMAYVGSKRILDEGGYEADSSVVYYGLPSRWADSIEEAIIKKARELAK